MMNNSGPIGELLKRGKQKYGKQSMLVDMLNTFGLGTDKAPYFCHKELSWNSKQGWYEFACVRPAVEI